MELRVSSIYDAGTAQPLEDKAIEAVPFYAVLDGVSGVYHPGEGWRKFDGKSGGQAVVEIAETCFKSASAGLSAREVLSEINARVRDFVQAGSLTEPKDIPGTVFAAAKVDAQGIEVVQCGDSFAVWEMQDGSVGATPNQNAATEERLLGTVRTIAAKYPGDKDALWREYTPILAEAKKAINRGGHVVLNGDKAGEGLWFCRSFAVGELKTLLLVTDGMVTFEESKDEVAMARLLVDTYKQGGVERLLARIRTVSGLEAAQHIRHAEATAVALEFV